MAGAGDGASPNSATQATSLLSPTSLFADFASDRVLHAGVASALANSPPWAAHGHGTGRVAPVHDPVDVAGSARSLFSRVHANGDGLVTRAELIKALKVDTELQEVLQLPGAGPEEEDGPSSPPVSTAGRRHPP